MKLSLKTLLSLVCASAFAMSCAQDAVPVAPEAQEETVVFTASVDAATKTTLNGVNTEWVAGDKITIHNGTKGFVFTAKSSGAKSDFTYTGSDFSGEKFMAVYPSGTYNADVNAKTVSGIVIPDKQVLVANTYPANATYAVAYSEDTSLSFKHAVAILKFKVAGGDVTKGSFYSVDGGDISGKYNLSYKDGNPEMSPVEAKAWVDFDMGNAVLSKDATYYIAVAPTTFTKGFEIALNGVPVKKYSKSYTIKPNTIVDLGTIEYDPAGKQSEWALTGAFSSWKDQYFVTTKDANVLVVENVVMKAAEGFLVRKPSTEWADKYGAGNVNYIKENNYIITQKEGADMCLEVDGTYDIYFNTNTKAIYVMADGVNYSTATKQTASGKEPVQEEPEVTENKLSLKPNSNWKVDNARFAAYFFGGTPAEVWVSMKDDDKDGTYEVNLPAGYDYGCNVIFCRMNPSTTANNWNNKWNQTSDLKTPTDGKNLYTVKDGTWDKGGGTWSKK